MILRQDIFSACCAGAAQSRATFWRCSTVNVELKYQLVNHSPVQFVCVCSWQGLTAVTVGAGHPAIKQHDISGCFCNILYNMTKRFQIFVVKYRPPHPHPPNPTELKLFLIWNQALVAGLQVSPSVIFVLVVLNIMMPLHQQYSPPTPTPTP